MPPLTGVTAVRTARHDGFDRFVIELNRPVPSFQVLPQASPTFTLDASGQRVTLQGSAGVLIRLREADNHSAYSGAGDLRPGLPVLKQARLAGDFEGVVTWALGVSGPVCVRVQAIDAPARLVVDVRP